MREIREKVRSIYNNVGDTLPVGVHRLTTTEAVNEFATWRKNIARGIISGHFVEEPKASNDVIPDLHSSIITPKFSSNENRVSFEQYQRFLTSMDEENRQISRKRPRDSSPETDTDRFTLLPAQPSSSSSSSSSLSSSTQLQCSNCDLNHSASANFCSL